MQEIKLIGGFRNTNPITKLVIVAGVLALLMFAMVRATPAYATANTMLDVFEDRDSSGSGSVDFIGPGGAGFVQYNQDDVTGDLRIVAKLQKSGAANEAYRIFVVCGSGSHAGCGFTDIGGLTTNGQGIGNSGELIMAKCDAQLLMSADAGNTFHVDILMEVGNSSTGLFVADGGVFDPSVGPIC